MTGTDAVLDAVSHEKAKLVFLAVDAGGNAAKKFRDKCSFYKVPVIALHDRVSLGNACGKSHVIAVAVTDPGFAAKLAQNAGDISGGVLFD